MVEMIFRRISLQCDYDPDGDVAHIHVADPAPDPGPLSIHSCELKEMGGRIDLHLDAGGRLVRIEVAGANRTLPVSLLRAFSS